MRLKFKTIQIHNFMSFGDEVFDYSSLSGLTLIKGINHDALNDANGCGKTCMRNALIYTLFGQVQDLKNQSLVNRNADDKDMRLVLDLTSNDNEYKIKTNVDYARNEKVNKRTGGIAFRSKNGRAEIV